MLNVKTLPTTTLGESDSKEIFVRHDANSAATRRNRRDFDVLNRNPQLQRTILEEIVPISAEVNSPDFWNYSLDSWNYNEQFIDCNSSTTRPISGGSVPAFFSRTNKKLDSWTIDPLMYPAFWFVIIIIIYRFVSLSKSRGKLFN